MNKHRKTYRGPIEGKKIEFAETDQVESYVDLANEFMETIFDLMPSDYLITDESSLTDFTDFGSNDTSGIWALIEGRYAIDRAGVGSERLVRIFSAIIQHRNVQ